CHYFVYPDRAEDQVLATVVRKVDTVKRELGSLGAVLLGQLEKALEGGITKKTGAAVAAIGEGAKSETVNAELESGRDDLESLRAEVERAGRRLESSRATRARSSRRFTGGSSSRRCSSTSAPIRSMAAR